MNNSFKSLIESAKSILIMLPVNPNFDEVGAGLSLFLSLKNSDIYSPTPITVEFNRLFGVNKIKSELGNKNVAITFVDYNPNAIEKVSYDIEENKEFKLSVVTKPGATPPAKDQIQITYTGIAADLVILVGGNSSNSFEAIQNKDLESAHFAYIGISEVLISNRNIASLAKPGSSVSEVVANTLKDAGMHIEADVATNLLVGIEDASENFTSGAVTADTFSTVAELMRAGGKRTLGKPVDARDFPVGAMPQGFPPQGDKAPQSWLEPKIYKGTNVS